MQQYISSDKNIRDFVQNILRSGQWEVIRHEKHVIERSKQNNRGSKHPKWS